MKKFGFDGTSQQPQEVQEDFVMLILQIRNHAQRG